MLLITTDKFIQQFDSKTKTDVLAFDVVPRQLLLHKLDHYKQTIRQTASVTSLIQNLGWTASKTK